MRRLLSLVVFALAACTAAPAAQVAQPAPDDTLRIAFFDVGQGDAALITTASGRRVLVDAGPVNAGVAMLLRRMGVDTLDLVVASHGHADHIGGMPAVFATLAVRAYMDNGIPHTTQTYQRTMQAVQAEPGLQYLQATRRTIRLGGIVIRVLPPSGTDSSQNNNSAGLVVEHGAFRALFTGDSERRQLTWWLAHDSIGRVSLVKAAHHGAQNGATEEWVAATRPGVVVVPVGRNSYGHPSASVIDSWTRADAQVYATTANGLIIVKALPDGTMRVVVERGGPVAKPERRP